MIPKPKRLVDRNILEVMRRRNCDVCGRKPTKEWPNQACHIRSRGAGGNDEESNLYTGCVACHKMQHDKGFHYMFEKYPFFRQTIYAKGWTIGADKKLRRE